MDAPAERPPRRRRKLKALDLCCGRGGWTKGLLAAGFKVTGIDIVPQPDYPSQATFIQGDIHEVPIFDMRPFDVVTCSPPCQGFSYMNRQRLEGKRPTAEELEFLRRCMSAIMVAKPRFWAVENVRGAIPYFNEVWGPPRMKWPPWFMWGRFPGFLVERDRVHKYGGTLIRGRYSHEDRKRWANAPKRQRAAVAAEVPLALARPFAFACADAISPVVVRAEVA